MRHYLDPHSEVVIRRIAQVLGADEDELINLAGKVPKELKEVLKQNPYAVELLRVLSERKLPDDTYRKMLNMARHVKPEKTNDDVLPGREDSKEQ